MELTDWTIEYVKARNAMRRTLIDYHRQGEEITFVHRDKTHHFLISPVLRVPVARDSYTVVCLHNEQNLSFLINNWSLFCQQGLSVLFANPARNVSWQINPRVHQMVADPDTLEQGVRSMASEVPEV